MKKLSQLNKQTRNFFFDKLQLLQTLLVIWFVYQINQILNSNSKSQNQYQINKKNNEYLFEYDYKIGWILCFFQPFIWVDRIKSIYKSVFGEMATIIILAFVFVYSLNQLMIWGSGQMIYKVLTQQKLISEGSYLEQVFLKKDPHQFVDLVFNSTINPFDNNQMTIIPLLSISKEGMGYQLDYQVHEQQKTIQVDLNNLLYNAFTIQTSIELPLDTIFSSELQIYTNYELMEINLGYLFESSEEYIINKGYTSSIYTYSKDYYTKLYYNYFGNKEPIASITLEMDISISYVRNQYPTISKFWLTQVQQFKQYYQLDTYVML
ncbi:unnamed protein product [Paramecium sonneborni]|uniref:Transmembrane protein n=1 Tax=Paramecium sonneborni TaxID=65129 RepID=A0A8S1RPI3_9CILI|nr:unnamed protein product [Paramecium sonneborni]